MLEGFTRVSKCFSGFFVDFFAKSRSGCSRCTLAFFFYLVWPRVDADEQSGCSVPTLRARCIMGEEGKAGWTVSLAPGRVPVSERRLFSSQPLLPWTVEALWFPARAPSFFLAPRPSISAGKSSPAAPDFLRKRGDAF